MRPGRVGEGLAGVSIQGRRRRRQGSRWASIVDDAILIHVTYEGITSQPVSSGPNRPGIGLSEKGGAEATPRVTQEKKNEGILPGHVAIGGVGEIPKRTGAESGSNLKPSDLRGDLGRDT